MTSTIDRLASIFTAVDASGDGLIWQKELAQVFSTLDPKWDSGRVDTLLKAAGLSEPICFMDFLRWLEDPSPLKSRPEKRARFLEKEWSPYLARLQHHLDEVRSRRDLGYSPCEIMPSQSELSSLAQRCLQLTRRWHGRANLSAFYSYFMAMAECDGQSPYRFEDLRQERSPDGYTKVLNGSLRKKLYTGRKSDEDASYTGRMSQSAGESPIDNLVMPNIMLRRCALLLTAGYRVQQLFLRALQWKQRRILESLGLVEVKAGEPTCSVVSNKVEKYFGKEPSSLAARCLVLRGYVLNSYGQLPDDAKARVDAFLSAEIGGEVNVRDDMAAFVQHCREHPGRTFQSAVEHKAMLLRAMASRSVRVIFRSDLEPFTQHRYVAIPWTRSVPLQALSSAVAGRGHELHRTRSGQTVRCLRPAGTLEVSRFRKNVFPYGESHGLAQSGGGCAEQPEWQPGSLMYELGGLLCVDEAAKVPHHGVTDLEKIVRECVLLCPEGDFADALPGESLHDVATNPISASSIGPTQHSQVMRASASDFPLLTEQWNPQWHSGLGAWLDTVQVGTSADAFFVSVRTKTPDATPVLEFVTGLHLAFLDEFGENVDFYVGCHPTPKGEFVICFAPVACLRRKKRHGRNSEFVNPSGDTGPEILPCCCVGAAQGKGILMVDHDDTHWNSLLEGRKVLCELYDFNCKLGARPIAESYLRKALCGN